MEIIRGAEFLVGPRIRVRGTATQGKVIDYIYEGTLESIANAESFLLPGTIYEADYTNPPKATLTITSEGIGNDEVLLGNSWDMRSNTQQKSIYEHPIYSGLSDLAFRQIKKAIQKNELATDFVDPLAADLYADVLRGQDYYIVSQPVFKVTTTIRTQREYNFAEGNQNRVYSNAQLILEANPPAPFIQSIANKSASMLTDLYQGTIPTGYTLGWLKQNYELVTLPGSKTGATIEYWLEAWRTGNSKYLLSTVIVS